MHYINAIIVGIIQGLTEFLPVSSSGHLVLSQYLLGVEMPGVTFEIFLHFGTLISVFYVFRERIGKIINSYITLFTGKQWDRFASSSDRWFGLLLVVGTIPTALLGFLLKDTVEQAFADPGIVGYSLLVTGALLFIADRLLGGKKDISKTTLWDSLLIGVFQGLAVFPGVSRSGSTISGALFRKLDKKTAAEYSFLLSIPAIAGATLLELVDVLGSDVTHDWLFYGLGVVTSVLAGIAAIKIFLKLLDRNRLTYFAIYCWTVAVLVIIFI